MIGRTGPPACDCVASVSDLDARGASSVVDLVGDRQSARRESPEKPRIIMLKPGAKDYQQVVFASKCSAVIRNRSVVCSLHCLCPVCGTSAADCTHHQILWSDRASLEVTLQIQYKLMCALASPSICLRCKIHRLKYGKALAESGQHPVIPSADHVSTQANSAGPDSGWRRTFVGRTNERVCCPAESLHTVP